MRRFGVKVIPRSRRREFGEAPDGSYRARVVASPDKERANEELLQLIAEYFRVRRSAVRIVRGSHRCNKVVEIDA